MLDEMLRKYLDELVADFDDATADEIQHLCAVAARPDPKFAEPERWEAAIHEGGELLGWKWLNVQQRMIAVVESFGNPPDMRGPYRTLIAAVALEAAKMIAEERQRAAA